MLQRLCLVVAILGLLATTSKAHELSPAVADLSFAPGSFTIALAVNLEVLVARIEPENSDTNESANAADYDRLRAPAIEGAGAEPYTAYLTNGLASDPIAIIGAEPKNVWETIKDYVWIGFTHIVPKGLDHILFVVGLFLLSASLSPLLWQVTAFTVAHTMSLALGMLGFVAISPGIVEPLIALSIAYVAIENVFTAGLSRWRPLVVFGFGLLHGLGFAGVLTGIGLSSGQFVTGLISFNVGVELGQLTVILGCLLAFGFWFAGKSWYRARVTVPMSLAIAAIGLYWFVERAFLA